MPNSKLSVREITAEDVDNIADYWLQSDPEYYYSMGCDLTKFLRDLNGKKCCFINFQWTIVTKNLTALFGFSMVKR